MFCLIQILSAHPTSTKVSDQLTKITKSGLLPTHIKIIQFPVWAGFKCNSLNFCSIGVSKRRAKIATLIAMRGCNSLNYFP